MLNYNLDRIDCEMSWPEVKAFPNFEIQQKLTKQHQDQFSKDYAYLGNAQIDFQKLIDVDKENTNFFWRRKDTEFQNSFFEKKYFALDDENFSFINSIFDLDHAKCSVQLLRPGICIGAHYDHTMDYHNELSKLLPDYESRSVNEVFNIFIMFLQPWEHGQAFMVGRQAYMQWEAGDVISFPWYMIHSTVNASKADRTILYTVGTKLK